VKPHAVRNACSPAEHFVRVGPCPAECNTVIEYEIDDGGIETSPHAVPEQLVDRDSADHDLLLLLPRHVEKLDRLVGPFGESKEVARVETNNEDARSLSRRSR
jgi:hypothetical protein